MGLALIYSAVALDWQWIWGVLGLYWMIPDVLTGVTYFIEPISRRDHPALYWLMMLTWLALSVAMLIPEVAQRS